MTDRYQSMSRALIYAIMTADAPPEVKESILLAAIEQSPRSLAGEDVGWEKWLIGHLIRETEE